MPEEPAAESELTTQQRFTIAWRVLFSQDVGKLAADVAATNRAYKQSVAELIENAEDWLYDLKEALGADLLTTPTVDPAKRSEAGRDEPWQAR
jgi:hypothetical protein